MNQKPKFIDLPNGDSLHSESIRAIRLGDPQQLNEVSYRSELKPRVIVDFVVGDHGNSVVLDCESVEARDLLASELKAQLQ